MHLMLLFLAFSSIYKITAVGSLYWSSSRPTIPSAESMHKPLPFNSSSQTMPITLDNKQSQCPHGETCKVVSISDNVLLLSGRSTEEVLAKDVKLQQTTQGKKTRPAINEPFSHDGCWKPWTVVIASEINWRALSEKYRVWDSSFHCIKPLPSIVKRASVVRKLRSCRVVQLKCEPRLAIGILSPLGPHIQDISPAKPVARI